MFLLIGTLLDPDRIGFEMRHFRFGLNTDKTSRD
jgi:hypothetical protein